MHRSPLERKKKKGNEVYETIAINGSPSLTDTVHLGQGAISTVAIDPHFHAAFRYGKLWTRSETDGTPLAALTAVRPAVSRPASCWLSSRLPVKGSAQRDDHSQPGSNHTVALLISDRSGTQLKKKRAGPYFYAMEGLRREEKQSAYREKTETFTRTGDNV
ncbi:hypothetical protein FQN60_004592 [Etheostoma spectabile]|uniref:Uncharacterized protein n=1 Tax=Etheostoma spectabile TaxID=54343 RepID=A0A5J5DKG7_9PERO|nr:hypothetical protein FQN60_004592 [Etheostoma spectabile]